MRTAKTTLQHGFTLVELLIVVIILAILAAIVVPQFAASTTDAEDAALQTNLQNMRSGIEFYRQEHGHWPSGVASTGAAACPAGVASGGAVNTEAAFISALTEFTYKDGKACTGTDGTLFGPYVPEIPPNTKIVTVADQTKVKILTAGVLNPAPDGTTGWVFDNVTGQLLPNNN